MGIAALVVWVLTAGGGFFLLAKWVAGGGHRAGASSRFPPAVIFGHFLLAAAGLVLWIIYLITTNEPIGWIALIVLAPVALLGFAMLVRWIPVYRSSHATDARLTDNGFSTIVTYWPSEFSQIRSQYRFTRYGQGNNANELIFQFLFVMGAHGAHPF